MKVTVIQIFKDFLFKNFLYQFGNYFRMVKDVQQKQKLKSRYYSWDDGGYASFMMALVQKLEPRKYSKNELIFQDMEEVEEILFV